MGGEIFFQGRALLLPQPGQRPIGWLGLKEGTFTFMNSAPQARHVAKMESVARGMGFKAWEAKVPRQPGGTDQCGVHLIVNALLASYGIVLSAAQFPVLDLDPSGIWAVAFKAYVRAVEGKKAALSRAKKR